MLGKKLDRNLSQEEAAFATVVANYEGYKRVLPPTATLTLTESGWLAVLLQQQRYKAIQSARRRARRAKMHRALSRTLAWLFHPRTLRTRTDHPTKPLIGTVPRHT